jgi:hypothetical protein
MFGHLFSHIQNPGLQGDEILHVIGVISNPVRYHSRYRLFRQWREEMLKTPNVRLHVVEAVYGDRHPECAPEAGQDYDFLPVKITSEIWLKENLINLAVKNSLPKDWKYMAWVDCDVHFRDKGWAMAALQQLQHHNVIQPWSDAVDLDFYGGIHQHFKSFGSLFAKMKPMWHHKAKPGYDYAHTGFAWCCTRYFYENVEKLLDFCIIGSGDHHMAWAMVGKIEGTIHSKVCDNYMKLCKAWQEKARYACAEMVGYVHGRIEHQFHGPKARRQYWSRWDILLNHKYDPTKDLAYDSQGILQLKGKPLMERDVMLYNRARLEDSIEQY